MNRRPGAGQQTLLVADGQELAALGAAATQDLASVGGGHAGAEAVFAGAFDFRWMICRLHGVSLSSNKMKAWFCLFLGRVSTSILILRVQIFNGLVFGRSFAILCRKEN